MRQAAQQLVRILEGAGVDVTVTSTVRDLTQQRHLWDCYQRTGCSNCRRGPGCYPAAPPGSSMHDRGLAFDMSLKPPLYAEAGALWEMFGGVWGGHFNDPIHFDARHLVGK